MVERIPEMMWRAFSQLRVSRPAPVLLENPADVLRGEATDEATAYSPVATNAIPVPQASHTAL